MKHEKTVDVYGHVTCLRAQRNYMVQTEDQYIFIHDALLEVSNSKPNPCMKILSNQRIVVKEIMFALANPIPGFRKID